MWINRIHCCLLAVAHLYILNHLVYSQESDSSYKAQNLTCITHKLVEVICTWTTEYESTNNLGFSYEFCYTIGWQKNCSITEERSQEFPLILFGSFNIDITTLNSSEEVKPPIATNTFLLTEKDIKFVPPTPRIHRLTPDFISDTLELEWYDGGSNFLYQMDADWEIQILYKDPMEEVTLITYSSKLTGNDTLLYWKWTSNLPFNCTTHYVRIRCLLHENTFAGVNVWSEWSQPEHIPGKDTGSFGAVYPIERIVPVGSNMTFCCVWKKGENKFLLKYQSCPPQQCPVASLSNYSKLIHVQNVSASSSSGTNIWCQGKVPPSPDTPLYGTVLFAGYPPDVPQNVSCETQDLKEIICKWEQGRPTQLYGRRKTSYTLIEQISRRYVKYTGDNQHYKCNLLVLNNQTMYNITIHATNHLGHSEASLSINVKYRIHPQPPTDLTVTDNSPTNVSLSWYLPGSFMKTKLQFQVKVSNGTSTEERKMHLDGAENSRYTILVDNLHPYTSYTFQVRCSAAEPFFWKWSNWSKGIPHRTQEAPPAGKLDVWREKSADEGTVIIFWKPLPVPDRNGVIEGYEVSWIVPEAAMKKQSVSEVSNSIKIKLGRNDYIFTVVAKNKAGLSSPSLINSAEIPVGPVPTETGVAKEDGIQVAWLSDPSVTCGYTVRWCYGPEPCTAVSWETFPSNVTNPVIRSALFQPGVRYHFSLYGCKDNGYQLLKHIDGYTKELEPAVAPVFNVELTTSDSILIKWEDIPNEKSRGFLKGYLLHFGKGEEGTTKPKSFESGHRAINITNPEQKTLKIASLQGKTGYHLNLSGYTAGGIGPARSLYVVTKENAVGLIIAILIPVAIVVVLAVVTSIFCYRKREWIKETFYPDIPNPENCKALEFPKDPEGNPNSKTLEMNPCTPNNIEVVETQTSCLKIEDAAIKLPVTEELPEDGLDSESESHIVVSYCPSIIEEEISNPPIDGSMGSSQVVYIDIQTMYPAPDKMKEDLEVDCVVAAGYKPQMQPPRNTGETTSVDEDLDKAAGYRPQVNAPSWNTDCPDSPVSVESNNENASFGSPCSINSRQFLIPPKEDEDSPEVINTGWSFSNFFHNKPND